MKSTTYRVSKTHTECFSDAKKLATELARKCCRRIEIIDTEFRRGQGRTVATVHSDGTVEHFASGYESSNR